MTEGSSSTPALPSVYLVRSAQKPTGGGRRTDAAAAGQTSYIVHTAVWNCTCAAFAFAAFPAVAAAAPVLSTLQRSGEGEVDEAAGGFGGMSFDGRGVESDEVGGLPPCCKHLLACVLVEKWAVLTGYVNERSVGREELAGIFAGI